MTERTRGERDTRQRVIRVHAELRVVTAVRVERLVSHQAKLGEHAVLRQGSMTLRKDEDIHLGIDRPGEQRNQDVRDRERRADVTHVRTFRLLDDQAPNANGTEDLSGGCARHHHAFLDLPRL